MIRGGFPETDQPVRFRLGVGAPQDGVPRAAAAATPRVAIVPANEASWEDLQAVLGRGYPSRCQCQRFKNRGREWDAGSVSVEERAHRRRAQTETPGQEITWDELRVGSCSIFADAGFMEVSHPTLRRVVMRIDF